MERKHILLFLGGMLFGSAGIKLLSSSDAKKAYTHVTAAALRCKDSVIPTFWPMPGASTNSGRQLKKKNLSKTPLIRNKFRSSYEISDTS